MNKIPVGYKQTEAGVIPEDWDGAPLGALSDVIMGQSPLGSTYNKAGQGVALINGPTEFTDIHPIKVQWTTQPTKLCKQNDLLICVRGSSTGRMNISNDEYCIGRGVAAIRAKSSSNTVYLTNQIHLGLEKLLSLSAGSTFPNVDGKSIRSIPIPLPPTLAEQTAIANALSDADALIQSLEKLIAKKRAIKQGAMQELLTGKKRLPGFARKTEKYKQTEVGVIPEDWELRQLRTMLKQNPTYGINAASVPLRGNLPVYIRITDISDEGYFVPTQRVGLNHALAGKYFLENGDLVFARTGASVGKSYLHNPDDGRLVYAGFLIKIEPDKSKLLPTYLAQYVKTQMYWSWVQVMSMRSGQPGINGTEYGQLFLPLPPTLAEQTRIATILSDMDAEITALKIKLTKYKQIKQGMMQNLLTGRIRLI